MAESSRKDAISRSLRDTIQATLDHAEAEHRRELFKRRLELARAGLLAYREKKIGEAVKAFLTYIKILEQWKKVSEGGLTPSHFDIKNDAPELLLISGVYWDLAKLFDRSQRPENYRDFSHYLSQFVIFSRGMPFESLSSESLRKYIRNEKPVHKEDFKRAYARLGGGKCFVVTSLLDYVELDTLDALRDYRDERLTRSAPGRWAVAAYYRVGPKLAWALDRSPAWTRRAAARTVVRLAGFVQAKTVGKNQ
jgi:hypothetical protein